MEDKELLLNNENESVIDNTDNNINDSISNDNISNTSDTTVNNIETNNNESKILRTWKFVREKLEMICKRLDIRDVRGCAR